jgi:hypothetical protein
VLADGTVVSRDIARLRPPPMAVWWCGPALALAIKR